MPKGDIKQTIRLAGEKEYTAALKSANTQLKTLKTALKAETAELGKNATAQEKNAAKMASLKKQIAEQEKIVETLTKALAEAKRDYADNEEVVAKWEQKLNNARATLAGMQNDLEGLGDSVADATSDINMGVVATRSFAETLASIGDKAGSISSTIENIFKGVVDTVRNAVGELWEIISETAAKANNWTDLAGYYGSTASDIQKWNKSIEAAGGSFENFIQLVNTFAYGGKTDAIETWFGVSDKNYTDMVQYTLAVMAAMQDARKKMTEGEAGAMNRESWNTAMQEIFGTKKSQTAEWFFGAWDDWFGKADRFNGEGLNYGMSAEDIKTLNDVWVQISDIETKWQSIKEQFAAGFGEITGSLLINVSGSLDALNAYLKADSEEERAKALEDLKKNMEEFFRKLAEAIRAGLEALGQVADELAGSEDPITAGIGKALQALESTGTWLIDHSKDVVGAIETIAAVWITGKGAAMALKIAEMVAHIKLVQGFLGGGGSVLGGASGAAGGAGLGGSGIASAIAGLGTKVAPALAGLAQNAPLIMEAADQIEKWGVGGALKKWATLGGAMTDEEVEAAKAAGVKELAPVNVLSLLLNPLNEIARVAEENAAKEDKSGIFIDPTNTKWVEQFGDVRWGWKDWSWNHDDMWPTMPEAMFTAGEQDEIESLIDSHEASVSKLDSAIAGMPEAAANAIKNGMAGVSLAVYVRTDDITRAAGGRLAEEVYMLN